MSRQAIKAFLFSTVNVAAVTDLLGAVSTENRRLYYGWPQVQPVLSDAPTEPAEGWLTFHERSGVIPLEGLTETLLYEFNIFATSMALCDDVLDQLDTLLHFKLAGHGGFEPVSGRDILRCVRISAQELYEDDRAAHAGIKLYRKQAVFSLTTVKRPFQAGV
jgi:hypothetical protein